MKIRTSREAFAAVVMAAAYRYYFTEATGEWMSDAMFDDEISFLNKNAHELEGFPYQDWFDESNSAGTFLKKAEDYPKEIIQLQDRFSNWDKAHRWLWKNRA